MSYSPGDRLRHAGLNSEWPGYRVQGFFLNNPRPMYNLLFPFFTSGIYGAKKMGGGDARRLLRSLRPVGS